MSKFNKRLNKEANTGIKEERAVDKVATVEDIAFPEEKIEVKKTKKQKKSKNDEHVEIEEEGLHYDWYFLLRFYLIFLKSYQSAIVYSYCYELTHCSHRVMGRFLTIPRYFRDESYSVTWD